MKKMFLRSFVFVLIFSLLLSTGAAYASGGANTKVSNAKNAIVRVYAEFKDGTEVDMISVGSAFAVGKAGTAPEYFVTNAHVLLDDYGNLADKIYLLLDNDAVDAHYNDKGQLIEVDKNESKMVECDVVNRNLKIAPDVAVLHAHEAVDERVSLPLVAGSSLVDDGTDVYALGFPGDVDVLTNVKNSQTIVADVNEVTLSSGILSKKTTSELLYNTSVLIHSAPISSGCSGGPLINKDGAVIGINTYTLTDSNSSYISIYLDYAIDILDANGIPYDVYGQKDSVKIIVLCAVMLAAVVGALLLVLSFKRKESEWVENEDRKKREADNALRIQGVSGAFSGRRFPLEGQVSFGRDPSNNIAFPAGTAGVSGNHCVVIKSGSQILIKDLGSTYGTVVNGTRRLPANQAQPINVGDKFALGSDNETFVITRKGGRV